MMRQSDKSLAVQDYFRYADKRIKRRVQKENKWMEIIKNFYGLNVFLFVFIEILVAYCFC